MSNDTEAKKEGLSPNPGKTRRTRLPFTYPGSKSRLMRHIMPWIPPHDLVVDVFGGTGTMLTSLPRSKVEVYNDLNEDLVNVFAVLRNAQKRRQLKSLLQYTLHSRRMFEQCLNLLHQGKTDDVERAWAYLVVGNQARAVLDPTIANRCGWGYQRHGYRADRYLPLPTILDQVAERFRGVQVECKDWEDILKRYDSVSTLFLLDPPYPHDVRVTTKLYKREMSYNDHEALLQRIQLLKGLAILCSYDNALYRKYLTHWKRIDIDTRCAISSQSVKPRRTEVVWMNYEFRSVSQS